MDNAMNITTSRSIVGRMVYMVMKIVKDYWITVLEWVKPKIYECLQALRKLVCV